MGGKNRSKKLLGSQGASSSKKQGSSSVKVANKKANKLARQQGVAELASKGRNVDEKKAHKATNKADRAAARSSAASSVGPSDAASRKKKRKHSSSSGTPSVKQMKQHAHEPRAMAKHDASYNARAQSRAEKRAGGGGAGSTEAEEGSDEEHQANEADSRFFEQHSNMTSFLDNLDADSLAWSKPARSQPKERFPQPDRSKHAPSASAGSGSDEDEDDEDEGSDESESDEKEEGPAKKKPRGERGVASFERTPRKASWASEEKVPKARLPVRSEDGSWGASEVTKADSLRARAERIESMQRKGAASSASASSAAGASASAAASPASASEGEDEEMLDAEASASDGDEEDDGAPMNDEFLDSADDDEEQFDDSLPNDEEEEDEEDLDAELDVEDVSASVAAARPPERIREQQSKRQTQLKMELAENSELILENPDKNLGKMENMVQLCLDGDVLVAQLALMSCVEVLVDLLPSYRIRLPSPEEVESAHSKETKATWKFERLFLLYYGRTVQCIQSTLSRVLGKETNNTTSVTGFTINVLRCGLKMLEKGFHFNYRKELIALLAPLLNHAAPQVRLLVFQSLVTLFRTDVSGESSLESLRILGRIVKERGRRVKEEVVKVFLYLPLSREIIEARVEEKKAPVVKKKGHSFQKIDDRELNRDLAESEATVSVGTRKKIQAGMLREVFGCYFRILKQQKTAAILPVVLRGLSKFATLVDVELVVDLLDCLKATIGSEHEEPLSVESTLYVILTAFQVLGTHGGALAMDLKEFYNRLYALLFSFCLPGEVCHVPLLLLCLEKMFLESKQLSMDRVAAFLQRLGSICLYLPPEGVLGVAHMVRLILNKYPRTKQILDREVSAPGVFLGGQGGVDDPDLANAFATTLWEVGLLRGHVHPFVPVYASSILSDETLPLSLSRMSPRDLFENYDSSEGGFNPPLPLPSAFTSSSAAAGTSTTMRKKIALRRRVRMRELDRSLREARFQSPFLQSLVSEAAQRSAQPSAEKLRSKLEHLARIRAQFDAYRRRGNAKSKPLSNGTHAPQRTGGAGSSPPAAAAGKGAIQYSLGIRHVHAPQAAASSGQVAGAGSSKKQNR